MLANIKLFRLNINNGLKYFKLFYAHCYFNLKSNQKVYLSLTLPKHNLPNYIKKPDIMIYDTGFLITYLKGLFKTFSVFKA